MKITVKKNNEIVFYNDFGENVLTKKQESFLRINKGLIVELTTLIYKKEIYLEKAIDPTIKAEDLAEVIIILK